MIRLGRRADCCVGAWRSVIGTARCRMMVPCAYVDAAERVAIDVFNAAQMAGERVTMAHAECSADHVQTRS